jgi:hypothetical protein
LFVPDILSPEAPGTVMMVTHTWLENDNGPYVTHRPIHAGKVARQGEAGATPTDDRKIHWLKDHQHAASWM